MAKAPFPITELFGWVIDDPAAKHGIVGIMLPNGLPMQAVSSQRRLMETNAVREAVEEAAKISGHRVALKRFILAETIATVEP